jgi:DNA helicase HerA-like ATPase
MGATGSDSFYLQLLNDVMRLCRARANLTLDGIRAGIEDSSMTPTQRSLAMTRLEFAARFIDDGASLRSVLQPGRVVIVDVRDEFIEKEQALGLFVTMLNVFAGAGMGEESFNKLIVFDEAHKYMAGGPLINQVVEVIREMRHKGVSVIVASQDPINVPAPVVELSSVIALHKFNSPNWLRHIQRSVAALAELTPQMMQALAPGEAYLWASKASDPIYTRPGVRVRIRPRASKHGGSTRRASDRE